MIKLTGLLSRQLNSSSSQQLSASLTPGGPNLATGVVSLVISFWLVFRGRRVLPRHQACNILWLLSLSLRSVLFLSYEMIVVISLFTREHLRHRNQIRKEQGNMPYLLRLPAMFLFLITNHLVFVFVALWVCWQSHSSRERDVH
ncbi:hypothetical protein Bca52824_002556 [Brassica carinata]|uniref:Uncharacterized protein n=1 Tax=Brassica carinata TaxID=52824 RepID=A0A8X7WKH9_BRACI|nr:hypothetical protein Bca52824_002556 [Brassica carinata]